MTSGTICLIQFPFTDGSGAKVRPVLVVSQDRFNHGEDVLVVPISSRPQPGDPFTVTIPSNSPQFAATKLKQSSAVKWAKPFTTSKRLILRRLEDSISRCLEKCWRNCWSCLATDPPSCPPAKAVVRVSASGVLVESRISLPRGQPRLESNLGDYGDSSSLFPHISRLMRAIGHVAGHR